MRFFLTPDTSIGLTALQSRLTTELQSGKQVLWLVSGGSNIAASVAIMPLLPVDLLDHLTLMLSDERYGPIGHADSNYQQFLEQGFDSGNARFIPTLQNDLSLTATAVAYAEVVQTEFTKADIIIGQLGIGVDGHIAGALPGTIATSGETWVVGYQSNPYQRITMTFPALKQIDADYSLVYGVDKRAVLERLAQQNVALDEQPAQILKQLTEAYIYNDQLGDDR